MVKISIFTIHRLVGIGFIPNFIGYKTTLREQNIPIDIVFKFGEDKGYTIERLNKPVKSH